MMNAVLIGKGRWGKILEPYIRQFFDLKEIYGRDYCISNDIDVVFIATPIDTHYEIVKKALLSGKHVFCEKPLTTNYNECLELKQIAERNNLKLYTDYVEMTALSRKFMVENLHKIGRILIITGCFLKNAKVNSNILWHLHCHFISILSLFVDIAQLNYEIMGNFIYFQNNDFNGQIYCSMNSNENKKIFKIHGDLGQLNYNYHGINNVVLETKKETINYYFDEKNNLKFSISEFLKTIENNIKTNIDISCEITNIIEMLSQYN